MIKSIKDIRLDQKMVNQILKIYIHAWIYQDTKEIISIFTKGAIYHEYVLRKPYVGHAEIKKYWENRVIKEESDIRVKILNVYVDGNIIIAEWDARFYKKNTHQKIHMREVAILEIVGNKINSLREYWHAED